MRFTCAILAVLLIASITHADPATQPVAPVADVYLIPFAPLGGDNALDWAGKAVHQNLLTDLARAKLRVTAADKPIGATRDAQAAARAAGAKFIITGTYQVADSLVRFNGQILDNTTGNVLGGLSATGAPRDLFALEDTLSAQAIAELSPPTTLANGKPAHSLPPALRPAAVAQIINPPAVAQAGTASSYEGSALQQYVDSNRTPSTDYNQQVQDAENRSTFDYDYNTLDSFTFSNYGFGYGLLYSGPYRGYGYGYNRGWGGYHGHAGDGLRR